MLEAKRFIAVGCLFLMGVGAFALAQSRSSQHEGSQSYTPTRLEWLALEMNAGGRRDLTQENPFSLNFVPIADEDALLIYVKYLPSANREIMNSYVDTARQVIAIRAKSRGWTSWLKVKEQIEMAKDPQ